MTRRTLVHLIERWAERKPNAAAIHGKKDGVWVALTWAEYWERVRGIAKALAALGHREGECVTICGANHAEFVQYQFGIEAARGIPAPIYGTSTLEQTAYITKHCGARFAVVDGLEQLEKILECESRGMIEPLEKVLTFFPVEHQDERVMSLDEVLALGAKESDSELEKRLEALTEDDISIMIYTSGTTGVPKGVEIDHAGQMLIGDALLKWAPQFTDGTAEYHTISYLPLSHQAEQLMTNVGSLTVGGQVYFCPDLKQIKDYLQDVRPTVFLGVPRVWEKFEAALSARLGEAKGIKAKLASWATSTELTCFEEQVERGVPAARYMPLKRWLARKLVVDKVKLALGLDRLEIALTGSAPIAVGTQEFFASLGICIFEAYGMTETSGVATFTDRLRPVFGTVGKCLEGCEVRIGDEGEIQLKGRNCQTKYRGMPEKTKELYTDDGWLRTGDQGALGEDGNLKITGRLKELLITAGGKNVAPVELEQYVASTPGVGQVVVVGDRQPFLSALIALDPENLDALAEAAGEPQGTSMADLAASERVRSYLEKQVEERCNAKVARYQTIKKIAVLPNELTVEGGELTPSLKLRRPQILEKYAPQVEAFYEGGTLGTPQPRA